MDSRSMNLKVFNQKDNSGLFSKNANPNVRIREEKLSQLNKEITEFISDHLHNIGQLVDGNQYNL
jgi:hypothetical protein